MRCSGGLHAEPSIRNETTDAMNVTVASVTLLRFPRDDEDFERAVDEVARAMGGLDLTTPQDFQARVRDRFPKAVVKPQDPLGGYRVSGSAWYVYRDGSTLRR